MSGGGDSDDAAPPSKKSRVVRFALRVASAQRSPLLHMR
jgi:hypothetical protein